MANEDRLIQGLLRHEQWAQTELYNLFHSRLTGVLLTVYGFENREDIEEAVQDGFLEIYKSISQFSFNESLIGWCIVITKRCYWKLNRKKNMCVVNKEVVHKLRTKEIVDSHYNIPINECLDAKIDLQFVINYAEENITALGYELMMKSACGYSHLELAKQYGMSEGTIGSKIRKATQSIKEVFV